MYDSNFFKLAKFINDKHLSADKFNLFSILRSSSDEVRLHSRFLRELLNPKGSHELGLGFLNAFLEHIRLEFPATEQTKVTLEHKNIDIYLTQGEHALIIENKVFAGDQEKQLERYYKTALAEGYKNISIVYLTPHGIEPSKYSTGDLSNEIKSNIKLVSYESDIKNWIESSTILAANMPAVRESLIQYRKIINNITGNPMSLEHKKDLMDILDPENNLDNFCQFNYLAKAHRALSSSLLANVLKDFRDQGTSILGQHHDSHKLTDKILDSRCLELIEQKPGSKYISVFFKHREGVYYGIQTMPKGFIVGVTVDKDTNPGLYEKVHSIVSSEGSLKDKWYPKYEYLSPQIDFNELSEHDLRNLADQEQRKSMVDKAIEETVRLKTLLSEAGI